MTTGPTPQPRPRALIVVPDTPAKLDAAAELTVYCERRGYLVGGLMVGTDRRRWAAAVKWALSACCDAHDPDCCAEPDPVCCPDCPMTAVVVVPSRSNLDPGRGPRVESLTQECLPAVSEADRPARSWRTRILPRNTRPGWR